LDQGKVDFFGDSVTAINRYYGLTQSYRLLTAGESSVPLGSRTKSDAVGASSSQLVLEPVKLMHPNRDAAARFIGFAVTDKNGQHTGLFKQGEWLTVLYEIEVRAEIENLSCGISIRDDRGVFLHSKYVFQDDINALRCVKAGDRLRATISLRLDLNAGDYTLGLDLVSVPNQAMAEGKLTFAAFDLHHQRICGTPGIFAFAVGFNADRQGAEFSHLGLFDLPSRMSFEHVNR
jgi:hypothetical protein